MTDTTPEKQRAALMADETFRQRYLAGAPQEVERMREISGAIAQAQRTQEATAERERSIATWQRMADLPPETLERMRTGASITEDEYRNAHNQLTRLKKDPEWVRRYLLGGHVERTEMAKLSITLSAPVERAG